MRAKAIAVDDEIAKRPEETRIGPRDASDAGLGPETGPVYLGTIPPVAASQPGIKQRHF